jgi:predicted N-acetyltransferase YhbS
MPITYRPITMDEFDAFDLVVARGFSSHPNSNPVIKDFSERVFEPERSVAAFDEEKIVGTSAALTLNISVPGKVSLALGGIEKVTVSATHRRRGILTGMMRHQLDEHHERGIPLAALWPSESVIYGRFGYGISVTHEHREIDLRHTAFAHSPALRGQMHFVSKDDARKVIAPIHELACRQYPAMIARNDLGWGISDHRPGRYVGRCPCILLRILRGGWGSNGIRDLPNRTQLSRGPRQQQSRGERTRR